MPGATFLSVGGIGALVATGAGGLSCIAASAGKVASMTSTSEAFIALSAPFPNCTITPLPLDRSYRTTVPVSPDLLLP